MIYSLVPRHFVGGILCAGIGLLVISVHYLRAWLSLQDRANVIARCIPNTLVSLGRQQWPEPRYLQWGVFSSVLLFMLAGAANAENDWLFRLTGFLMGFCAALFFAMFAVGFVSLFYLWKELGSQLKRAEVGSLLLSIPLAAVWLALGLGVMLLAGMLVDKSEKLPAYGQALLRGLLYVPMWALIAIAFYGLWKGRSYAALMLRLILMVSFSAIITAAAAFAYWWFISQTALLLVLLLSAMGTLNVVFYCRWVRLAALKDNLTDPRSSFEPKPNMPR